MKELKRRGFRLTATAIFTAQQAMVPPGRGQLVAPYINRLDNISSDGTAVASNMSPYFRSTIFPAKCLQRASTTSSRYTRPVEHAPSRSIRICSTS